ncbi:MAG: hypothetical protein ACKOEV_11830, partial [Cytophagales bacterium]
PTTAYRYLFPIFPNKIGFYFTERVHPNTVYFLKLFVLKRNAGRLLDGERTSIAVDLADGKINARPSKNAKRNNV